MLAIEGPFSRFAKTGGFDLAEPHILLSLQKMTMYLVFREKLYKRFTGSTNEALYQNLFQRNVRIELSEKQYFAGLQKLQNSF